MIISSQNVAATTGQKIAIRASHPSEALQQQAARDMEAQACSGCRYLQLRWEGGVSSAIGMPARHDHLAIEIDLDGYSRSEPGGLGAWSPRN